MMGMGRKKISGQRGFTLVELAIAIAILALVFAAIWRVVSNLNQQLQDQAVARHSRAIARAALNFVRDYEATLLNNNASGWYVIPITTQDSLISGVNERLQPRYLPLAIRTTNIYGQKYTALVYVDKVTFKATAFVTATNATVPYNDVRGARLASLVGADGGYIYTTSPTIVSGAYGGWQLPISYFPADKVTLRPQDLVISTYYMAAEQGQSIGPQGEGPYLWRKLVNNDHELNRMSTTLYLGHHDIEEIAQMKGVQNIETDNLTVGNNPGVPRSFTVRSDASFLNHNITMTPPTNNSQDALNVNVRTGANGNFIIKGNFKQLLDPYAPPYATQAAQFSSKIVGSSGLDITGDARFGNVRINGTLTLDRCPAGTYVVIACAGNPFPPSPSDMRLKENIQPVPNALDKLMKIHGVSFSWKKDGRKDMGVIAQNVETVFPVLVSTDKQTGMKGVNYMGLISPIIEALRELKDRDDKAIQQLQEENKVLRQEVETLKAKITQ